MAGHSWFAIVQYAGGGFAGWQRQPADRTVQAELEAALARLAGTRVVTHAAGRTDAGVHALGQVVSFRLARAWDPADLGRALNALLPDDVWVARAGSAPDGFHARKDATARRYRYVVGCDAAACSPFRRRFEWALGRPLDPAARASAPAPGRGAHDIPAHTPLGPPRPHYTCTVSCAEWEARAHGQGFIFHVQADRFLHRMVRFIVGISVDVALGRRPLADIERLLTSTHNAEASRPAPPEGLYFVGAVYPQLQLESEIGPCSSSLTPRT
jgi:tRNA pseudouridine38-40 synthase